MSEDATHLYVSFILWGKDLNPLELTEELGIIPTRSFQRGDKRIESRKWPHGYWELDSSSKVQSIDLETHLEWIVSQLEPIKFKLNKLISSNDTIAAKISCFWILPGGHSSLSLSPMLLGRISGLGFNFEMDIYGDSPSSDRESN